MSSNLVSPASRPVRYADKHSHHRETAGIAALVLVLFKRILLRVVSQTATEQRVIVVRVFAKKTEKFPHN